MAAVLPGERALDCAKLEPRGIHTHSSLSCRTRLGHMDSMLLDQDVPPASSGSILGLGTHASAVGPPLPHIVTDSTPFQYITQSMPVNLGPYYHHPVFHLGPALILATKKATPGAPHLQPDSHLRVPSAEQAGKLLLIHFMSLSSIHSSSTLHTTFIYPTTYHPPTHSLICGSIHPIHTPTLYSSVHQSIHSPYIYPSIHLSVPPSLSIHHPSVSSLISITIHPSL